MQVAPIKALISYRYYELTFFLIFRSLTCDINCIQPILNEHCPQLKKEPGNFLLQYTRIQVNR